MNFKDIAIKGRQSQGNILSRHEIHKIVMKERGISTLGGRNIWFDDTIQRLNTQENGAYIGEFKGDDKIVVIYKNGNFATSSFELTNHYEEDILLIEKMDVNKVYTCVFYDGEQKNYYIKRFAPEDINGNIQSIIGGHPKSRLICFSVFQFPQFEITFGGRNKNRPNDKVDAEQYIGVKGWRARGKRLTTLEVAKIKEIDPVKPDEIVEVEEFVEPEFDDVIDNNNDDIIDKQMSLDIE